VQPEDDLKRAADSIRAGDYGTARLILIETLRLHPNSEDGWLLLSYALEDTDEKLRCLDRVLHINPDNQLAQHRIAKLAPSRPIASAEVPQPVEEEAPLARLARAMGDEPVLPRAMHTMGRDVAQPEVPASEEEAQAELTPEERAEKRKARNKVLAIGGGVVLFFVVLAGGLYVTFGLIDRARATGAALPETDVPATSTAAATSAPTETAAGGFELPPEWTATPSRTPTNPPTATPTNTATVSPTPIPPDATTSALMDRINQEVADIRGLPVRNDVDRYVISAFRVRPILEASFLSAGGSEEALKDEAIALSALGLIKPTYDLYTNALNGLTDSLGGFYFPWSDELFVIGDRFSGIEHWVYSHEYAHALVDQAYDIGSMGVYPICEGDEQRCEAIQALTEGDATLVMDQWLLQYASPKDYQDIFNYRPPRQTLPEQFPPPYVYPDTSFPYDQGLAFVSYLYDRGNWAGVNQAYERLPDSTEQILHPGRYVSAEPVVHVTDPELGATLGSGWRLVKSNSLGEWKTYLILAYGADYSAEMDVLASQDAANGWGGDHYQVYYNDEADQTVLAAHWVWDTSTDQVEFARLMKQYLPARFRGAAINQPAGACWGVNGQVSCVYSSGKETLWLLTPEEVDQDTLLAKFPDFP
jgi:tetratricopeptide (TPR) repeat protein